MAGTEGVGMPLVLGVITGLPNVEIDEDATDTEMLRESVVEGVAGEDVKDIKPAFEDTLFISVVKELLTPGVAEGTIADMEGTDETCTEEALLCDWLAELEGDDVPEALEEKVERLTVISAEVAPSVTPVGVLKAVATDVEIDVGKLCSKVAENSVVVDIFRIEDVKAELEPRTIVGEEDDVPTGEEIPGLVLGGLVTVFTNEEVEMELRVPTPAPAVELLSTASQNEPSAMDVSFPTFP